MNRRILTIKVLSLLGLMLLVYTLTIGIGAAKDNPIFTINNFHKNYNYVKYSFAYRNNDQSKALFHIINEHADSIPVLLYHGIINESDGANVMVENFKSQMYLLKQEGWETISMAEFYSFLRGEINLPKKSFLLTFDDGRKDSYYPVDPILRVLDFKASMFIDTQHSIRTEKSSYYLSPNELDLMLRSGRWELQSHSRNAHSLYQIAENGTMGTYLGNKLWRSDEKRNETEQEFKERILLDLEGSESDINERFDINVVGFAFPYGDFGQYSGLDKIVLDAASSTFDISFYQYRLGGFTNNVPTPGKSKYFASRIIVDKDWNGVQLVSKMEEASSKDLPFEDYMNENQGWLPQWGQVEVGDGSLIIGSKDLSTGGSVLLDGTYLWRNYVLKAEIEPRKGDYFTLIGRFQDNRNYVSCKYSSDSVSIEQIVSGQRESLKTWNAEKGPIGDLSVVGIALNENTAGCYVGLDVVASTSISTQLKNGGIGFNTWDSEPGNSMLIISSVKVYK